ncbi:hypothetical protein EIN_056540 [Entamoeba invadens IP1]|uniref:hypothetical protein n=1 Tax=Entamoeba invadens IP1 TaxID=370355 RepID=UPI0002C3CEA4|nr:hypothetical protein EIN_056540 [Entamoeba invadens IP1]ELP93279.1 hypothetical protein EIN_056540 [Entamoeba invadens IP1]|eukprot:XP_004260050.1 hypothetical protein EIN_056540 [Entamoeba invadens IP1]
MQTLKVFDKEQNRFVQVTSDNHIQVFSTLTNKMQAECYDKETLDCEPSAIAICSEGVETPQKGETKNKLSVAVGNPHGRVVVWDVNNSKQTGFYDTSSPVTAVALSTKFLYIGTSIGEMLVINLESTEKRTLSVNQSGVSVIKLIGNLIIAGGIEVKIYNKVTLEKIIKQSIHLTSLRGIVNISNEQFITYSDEKHMFLCNTTDRNRMLTFSTDSSPVVVDALFIDKFNLLVAALLDNSMIDVYLYNTKTKTVKPIIPDSKIKVTNCVSLCLFTDRVMVALERSGKLYFQQTKLLEKGKVIEKIKEIVIDDSVDKTSAGNNKMIVESKMMEVVRPEDLEENTQNEKATFQQKLKAIEQLGTKKPETIELAKNGVVLTLTRALDTQDQTLIARCLNIDDTTVITTTVANLPVDYVIQLLDIVCDLFTNTPTKAFVATLWLKSIFELHLSYLMSVKEVHKSIAKLYSIIENRTTCYKGMLRLHGRMNLLLTQIEKKEKVKKEAKCGSYVEKGNAMETESYSEEEQMEEESSSEEEAPQVKLNKQAVSEDSSSESMSGSESQSSSKSSSESD